MKRKNSVQLPRTPDSSGVSYVLRFTFYFAALALASLPSPAAVDESKLPPASTNRIDFVRDIKPILDASCLKCHGPEKPKSGFRVDRRDALLKGGDEGVSVIPGQSAKSPFIHFVARLVEDMEMPPVGKGEPLTPAQIGLLRAWIDQDVPWGGDAPARTRVAVSPTLRYVGVDGDERKFREQHGFREGWNGGLESFSVAHDVSERTRALVTGRALRDDYAVTLSVERRDLGYLRGGFEAARQWYDGSGGYYAPFTPSQYDLDRDLHLDTGRLWLEGGWTAPFGTQFRVGYEYRFREGEKSLTRWLPAFNGAEAKRFLPNAKDIDETLHVLRLDVTHEWETLRLANSLRYDLNDIDSRHTTVNYLQPDTSSLRHIREQSDIDTLANAFTVEKVFSDWLFGSGGYLYTHLDGDSAYDSATLGTNGQPAFGGFWNGEGITLRRDAHVLNLNAQVGPFSGLIFLLAAQTEWNKQEAFGPMNFEETDFNNPPATTNNLSFVQGEIQRFIASERAGVRYTKIPFTVLYAEGEWRQESIDQQDALLPGRQFTQDAFSRDADLRKDSQRYRAGFDVSPWARVSFNAWYQRLDRKTDFDQDVQSLLAFPPTATPGIGYPGFLTRQEIATDEAGARLVLRPASWLKTTLSYRLVATDFDNDTGAIPGLAPGGTVRAGESDAHQFNLSATLTPWRRLFLFTSLGYQNIHTVANAHGNAAVVPYRGDLYTALASASYVLNEKTDAHLGYDVSYADFSQDNESAGLPLGLSYQFHTLRAGLSRQLTKSLRARLDYFFSLYDEPYSHGRNDYTAHGVFATLNYRWQ